LNTIKEAYSCSFNYNDIFNHYLNKRYFPHVEKSGWESNFTDFMFAAYQMNTYTLWHESEELKDQKMEYKPFTTKLYRSLMKADVYDDEESEVWRLRGERRGR
jgi:hypothetical protein